MDTEPEATVSIRANKRSDRKAKGKRDVGTEIDPQMFQIGRKKPKRKRPVLKQGVRLRDLYFRIAWPQKLWAKFLLHGLILLAIYIHCRYVEVWAWDHPDGIELEMPFDLSALCSFDYLQMAQDQGNWLIKLWNGSEA